MISALFSPQPWPRQKYTRFSMAAPSSAYAFSPSQGLTNNKREMHFLW